MSLQAFVDDLRQDGVCLEVVDGRLRYKAPKGVLTAERKAMLTQHKPELTAMLEAEVVLLAPFSCLIDAARRREMRGRHIKVSSGEYEAWYYILTIADNLWCNLDSPFVDAWIENLRRLSEWWKRIGEGDATYKR